MATRRRRSCRRGPHCSNWRAVATTGACRAANDCGTMVRSGAESTPLAARRHEDACEGGYGMCPHRATAAHVHSQTQGASGVPRERLIPCFPDSLPRPAQYGPGPRPNQPFGAAHSSMCRQGFSSPDEPRAPVGRLAERAAGTRLEDSADTSLHKRIRCRGRFHAGGTCGSDTHGSCAERGRLSRDGTPRAGQIKPPCLLRARRYAASGAVPADRG